MKKTATLFIVIFLGGLVFAGGGKNHIGVFWGQTSTTEFKHAEKTIGIEYERALPLLGDMLTIGATAEFVLADHTETLLLGIASLRPPILGLKLFAGAGFALMKVEKMNSNLELETEIESEFVLRIGTGYELHLGYISVTPSIALDRINGHSSLVYGVAVGIGF